MIHIRDGSGAGVIGKVHVRDEGGLFAIGKARIRDADGVSLIFTEGAAFGITPAYVSGYASSASAIFVTSDRATINAAPAGATIVWHCDNASITIVTPSANSTLFRAKLGSGITETGTAYATVNGVDTNSIDVELANGGIA